MNTTNVQTNKKAGLAKATAIIMLITAAINSIDAIESLGKCLKFMGTEIFEYSQLFFAIGGICGTIGFLLAGISIFKNKSSKQVVTASKVIVLGYLALIVAEFGHSWFFAIPTMLLETLVVIVLLLHLGSNFADRSERSKKRLVTFTIILMILSIILTILFGSDAALHFVGGNVIFMIIEFIALILLEKHLGNNSNTIE